MVRPGKIGQGQDTADELADSGSGGGPGEAPWEYGNKKGVQHGVGNAGGKGDIEPQLGLPAVANRHWNSYWRIAAGVARRKTLP